MSRLPARVWGLVCGIFVSYCLSGRKTALCGRLTTLLVQVINKNCQRVGKTGLADEVCSGLPGHATCVGYSALNGELRVMVHKI